MLVDVVDSAGGPSVSARALSAGAPSHCRAAVPLPPPHACPTPVALCPNAPLSFPLFLLISLPSPQHPLLWWKAASAADVYVYVCVCLWCAWDRRSNSHSRVPCRAVMNVGKGSCEGS